MNFKPGDLVWPTPAWIMATFPKGWKGTCPPALVVEIGNFYEDENNLNYVYYKVLIEGVHYFIAHHNLRNVQEWK